MPIYKKINKDFFKKWSRGMAYILGFMFADGNIIKTKRGTYFISIYSSDLSLMKNIKKFMGIEHKISRRREYSVYRIQIGSKEYFNDLSKLGFKENKTNRMRLPRIPSKYLGDFVRGYFDGDGNVWVGKIHKNRKKQTLAIKTQFTSCSENFLKDLHILLKKLGLEGGFIYKSKTRNFCRLSFSINDSLKIYKIMYRIGYPLLLERKKQVFERFMKMRE